MTMAIVDAGPEDCRLDALYRYDVLDTPPEESFDRITRLAKAVLETPIALVSLVDRERQWFKSRQGLEASQTPRDISFCAQAIQYDVPLIVSDASEDPRFRDNPLVVSEPKIRFYLGVPLRTPGGHNIGTLCVIDRRPRQPSPGQIAVMQDLARLVMDELELRQIAMSDSLTGAMTRRGFMPEAQQAFESARRYQRSLSCIVLDVDHFKSINDRHGHAAGDVVLRAITSACRRVIRSVDCFGRVGGEEFAIVLPETALVDAQAVAERLRQEVIASVKLPGEGDILSVTASLGVAELASSDLDIATLLSRADAAMYQAKHAGRNRVVVALSHSGGDG
jgi:diguanylate cyclase (GGDEF)-like protein